MANDQRAVPVHVSANSHAHHGRQAGALSTPLTVRRKGPLCPDVHCVRLALASLQQLMIRASFRMLVRLGFNDGDSAVLVSSRYARNPES